MILYRHALEGLRYRTTVVSWLAGVHSIVIRIVGDRIPQFLLMYDLIHCKARKQSQTYKIAPGICIIEIDTPTYLLQTEYIYSISQPRAQTGNP